MEIKHNLKVGSILKASWGYDQTNIDYFEVTKLIGTTMVEVREIGYATHDEDAFMQGTCTPAPGSFVKGKPALRRKVIANEAVKIFDWGCYARLIQPGADGKFAPSRWTAYA